MVTTIDISPFAAEKSCIEFRPPGGGLRLTADYLQSQYADALPFFMRRAWLNDTWAIVRLKFSPDDETRLAKNSFVARGGTAGSEAAAYFGVVGVLIAHATTKRPVETVPEQLSVPVGMILPVGFTMGTGGAVKMSAGTPVPYYPPEELLGR
jgi:hypothetical protein